LLPFSMLLACAVLLQGTSAEHRSSLRMGRAREAMPFITLPQSMLLQSSQGEQQESKLEVMKDAVETFFAGDRAAKATTAAAPAPAIAAPKAPGQLQFTTPAPTTTVPVTTMDPAALAKKMGISHEAAQARNLLVGMVQRAQLTLLNRLNDIGLDLEATELRAETDMTAVNHSFVAAQNLPIMANNAAVDVTKILVNGKQLQEEMLPKMEGRGETISEEITAMISMKKKIDKQLAAGKGKKLPGAQKRVQTNKQTMDVLVPRLEKLEKRVTKLEGRLYGGDLKQLVDDTTNKQVVDIMEDVSRGFGRFVENAK